MDYKKIEVTMKHSYAAVAAEYRRNDEVDVTGPDHRRLAGILSAICCSFRRPISVLDVGCGTGRFFHALRNVHTLIGMDVSEAMLEQARRPVCGAELSIDETRLLCGNFYTTNFAPGSFDLIYSLGVFGNGCALTVELCNKFHNWLSSDGCLFIDAIDSQGSPFDVRLRRHAKRIVYGMLPKRLQDAWDDRSGWLPMFVTSQRHLTRLFGKTKFPDVSVKSVAYHLPTGMGRKLECFAAKTSNR